MKDCPDGKLTLEVSYCDLQWAIEVLYTVVHVTLTFDLVTSIRD
jgi:hypothetical protein